MPPDVSKAPRREVTLDPALQARLLEQMRAERDEAVRVRMLRRVVLLPGMLVALVWSTMMALDDDMTRAVIGNIVGSSLLWFFWKVRRRVPAIFGFD